jgi:predicted DNA-binding transcriptional regulator AlpA
MLTMATVQKFSERYLTHAQTRALTGLSRAQLFNHRIEDAFPEPFRMPRGKSCLLYWEKSKVEEWMAKHPNERTHKRQSKIDPDLAMKVGVRIYTLARQKGLSIEQVANLGGIAADTVYGPMGGKKGTSVNSLSKICLGLGVTLSEFFEGVA